MSYIVIILMSIGVLLGLFIWHKINVAQREIEQLFRTKQALEAKVRQQAVEIQTKNAEVKNAHIAKRSNETVRRISDLEVDSGLHNHGWFRAEDNDNGLSGIQPDLRQSCGHDRDETADSCSQSDASGDL